LIGAVILDSLSKRQDSSQPGVDRSRPRETSHDPCAPSKGGAARVGITAGCEIDPAGRRPGGTFSPSGRRGEWRIDARVAPSSALRAPSPRRGEGGSVVNGRCPLCVVHWETIHHLPLATNDSSFTGLDLGPDRLKPGLQLAGRPTTHRPTLNTCKRPLRPSPAGATPPGGRATAPILTAGGSGARSCAPNSCQIFLPPSGQRLTSIFGVMQFDKLGRLYKMYGIGNDAHILFQSRQWRAATDLPSLRVGAHDGSPNRAVPTSGEFVHQCCVDLRLTGEAR
jgi:hypothetical protein